MYVYKVIKYVYEMLHTVIVSNQSELICNSHSS